MTVSASLVGGWPDDNAADIGKKRKKTHDFHFIFVNMIIAVI